MQKCDQLSKVQERGSYKILKRVCKGEINVNEVYKGKSIVVMSLFMYQQMDWEG